MPINVPLRKLCHIFVIMAWTHIDTIYCQRQNVSFFVNDKSAFKKIKQKISYKFLNLLLCEWIAFKKLIEKREKSDESCPDIKNIIYKLEYILSIQLGLLCKYFLYYCLVCKEPISLLLIYICWFLDGPLYISNNKWRIRFSDFCAENLILFQEKKIASNYY